MILVPVAPHHFCQPCKYMKFFGTSMILVPAAPTTPLQEQSECYKFIGFPTILVPTSVGGGGRWRGAAGGGRGVAAGQWAHCPATRALKTMKTFEKSRDANVWWGNGARCLATWAPEIMKTFLRIVANQLKCSPVVGQWGALPHHTGPEHERTFENLRKSLELQP